MKAPHFIGPRYRCQLCRQPADIYVSDMPATYCARGRVAYSSPTPAVVQLTACVAHPKLFHLADISNLFYSCYRGGCISSDSASSWPHPASPGCASLSALSFARPVCASASWTHFVRPARASSNSSVDLWQGVETGGTASDSCSSKPEQITKSIDVQSIKSIGELTGLLYTLH